MSTSKPSSQGSQLWWALVAAAVALVMALKPMGSLTTSEWKWLLGSLGAVMAWRIFGLLRSASSSPGRIFLWLVGMALVGSVIVVGIPTSWFRVPAWSEVASVVMPLAVGVAAITAVLLGLAGWNRHRELDGAPQRSYLPIVLNLIIVATVWHVVRQPLWKESLQGMMRLPQLHSNRVALEESLAPWVDVIQNGGKPSERAVGASAAPAARTAPSQESTATLSQSPSPARKVVASTHALNRPQPAAPPTTAPRLPARNADNVEQWIQAAVHNKENPALELRASVALVATDRADQALSRLAAARERGCQSPELIRFHSRLLRAKGRPATAAVVLESLVLSPDGTDQDLRESLGSWEQAGQMDRAENLAERLLVRRPSRELFRWLAARDAAEGRYERALVLLGQLSRRSPFDPEDAYRLADVALTAGRPELALDAVTLLEEAGHASPRSIRLGERARASGVAESPHLHGPGHGVRGS